MKRRGKGTNGVGKRVVCIKGNTIHSTITKFAHWLIPVDTSVHTSTKVFLILKMGDDERPYERIVL